MQVAYFFLQQLLLIGLVSYVFRCFRHMLLLFECSVIMCSYRVAFFVVVTSSAEFLIQVQQRSFHRRSPLDYTCRRSWSKLDWSRHGYLCRARLEPDERPSGTPRPRSHELSWKDLYIRISVTFSIRWDLIICIPACSSSIPVEVNLLST